MNLKYLKLSLVLFLTLSIVVPRDSYSKQKRRYQGYYNNYSQSIYSGKANLQNNKAKIQEKKKIVETLKKKEHYENFILSVLQKKIENTSIRLEDAKYRYAQTQRQIKVTDVRLRETEKDYKEQIKIMKSTIKRHYKYKYMDSLLFLLNSSDISTLMRRFTYLKYIIKHDNELINEVKKKKQEIKELKQDFQEKKVKIVAISKDVAKQKSQYEDLNEKHEEVLNETQTKREIYEREVKQLEQESGRIAEMLRSLLQRQKYAYANANKRRYASVNLRYTGGKFGWPCASTNLTSYYGYRIHPIFGTRKLHTGIDVGAGTGTPIYAAGKGVVIEAGWTGGYGKAVIIDHGGGIATLYAHTSELYVHPGQPVKRGQLIAAIGSTGYSTGPHLHFEVRQNGSPVDPLAFLR